MKIEWYCLLNGPRFSPRLAQARTGVVLKYPREPGEMGTSGRYRGQPLPYGSATLEVQREDGERFAPGDAALRELKAKLPDLREAGADVIELNLLVAYRGQCNLEFSADELSKLAELGIPLLVSCYEEKD